MHAPPECQLMIKRPQLDSHITLPNYNQHSALGLEPPYNSHTPWLPLSHLSPFGQFTCHHLFVHEKLSASIESFALQSHRASSRYRELRGHREKGKCV
jgi:hypothetical protein